MKEEIKYLKTLTELNAVPGNEKQVRDFLEKELTSYSDEVLKDNIGSIVFKKEGLKDGPKVLISGHMDEVGFMVSEITNEGFIKFIPLGGWWSQVMLSQKVQITTKKGVVIGVIGSKPPHILTPEERKTPMDISKMFIDLGVDNKEEAIKLGVNIGDMITPYMEFAQLGNPKYLLAKAWDNRIGCAIVSEVLKRLKNENHPNTFYGACTVQEEVGTRGAQTVGNMINPDIVFAVDVGIGNDVPFGDKQGMELGKGPQILLSDSRLIGHKDLREFVTQVADELNIPYQLTYLKAGGTDAGAMHLTNNGSPAINILIPCRYMHSHTSIIHYDDYLNAVKLIIEVIKRLDYQTINTITYN